MGNLRQSIRQKLSRLFRARVKSGASQGFTLIEILIAFTVLLIILAGATTAMTASMRLNSSQKQEALAQDVVRDVISSYVKNVDFFDDPATSAPYINPFYQRMSDDSYTVMNNPNSYYGSGNQPYKKTIYGAGTDNLTTGSEYAQGGLQVSRIKEALLKLQNPKLEIQITPIKKNDGTFYETKVNVMTRLTWNGGSVEIPSTIGEGDLTRVAHERFNEPEATPTPAPTPTPSAPCAGSNVLPNANGFGPCCSGLTPTGTGGVCVTSTLPCAGEGILPNTGTHGACCSGFTPTGTGGVCTAGASCTALGEKPGWMGNPASCCAPMTPTGSGGVCEVPPPPCAPAGNLPNSGIYGTCCTGLTPTGTGGVCETPSASCTASGEKPGWMGNPASCCTPMTPTGMGGVCQ